MLRIVLIVAGVLVAGAAAFALIMIGPHDLIGMLRYDTRRQGRLKVGDHAPDVALVGLDGSTRVDLLDAAQGRPLVLVFGSFT